MSNQGAPSDHPENRERVPCIRRKKSKTGLAPRTRERMVVYQLVCYKTVIRNSLQTNTLSESEENIDALFK
jgi:hypothetical protein